MPDEPLRRAVRARAGADAAGAAVLAWWSRAEDAGWRIVGPIATAALGLLVLCVLPALALALAGRALSLAALLAAAPVLLALYGCLSG
jgi:hypothetical protein